MKTINDYAELVKAEHALNKTIAPVEDGANIVGSYTSGKQFIRGGVLYTALTTIAANTAWSSLTLDTDYEVADDITSQLASVNQTLTKDLTLEVDTRKRFNVDNLGETTLNGSGTVGSASYVVNADKSITVTVNSTLSEALSIPIVNGWSGFDISEHIGEKLIVSGYNNNFCLHTIITDSNDQVILSVVSPVNGNTIIVPSGANKCVFLLSLQVGITAGSTFTYYPRLSVAMTNQELTPIAQTVSNRNLFDNPWFTVNQRGLTTSLGGYIVDRWNARNTSKLDAISNGIKFTNVQDTDVPTWIRQNIELSTGQLLVGKTLTISVMSANGNIFSIPFVLKNTSNDIGNDFSFEGITCRLRYEWQTGYLSFLFYVVHKDDEISLRAFKLELGSVSTLAQDTAPNYAEELAKCQRYFQRYYSTTGSPWFNGLVVQTNMVRFYMKVFVPMRANPTVSISDIADFAVTPTVGSARVALTALTGYANNHFVYFDATPSSSFTVGDGIVLSNAANKNGYIDLSADL